MTIEFINNFPKLFDDELIDQILPVHLDISFAIVLLKEESLIFSVFKLFLKKYFFSNSRLGKNSPFLSFNLSNIS